MTAGLVLTSASARADPSLIPAVQLGVGTAFHIAPEAEQSTQLAFDATVGAILVQGFGFEKTGAIAGFDVGYAYDGLGLHAIAVAPSIGYGNAGIAYLAYHPRLLVGDGDGEQASGMRNGIALHVLGNVFSLEVGHQFTSYRDAIHHSIQLTFAVNPGALLYYRLQR